MNGTPQNNAAVLEELNAVEGLLSQEDLNKAQITRGGNSDRPGWAGSEWEKEDPSGPGSTPGGTDYRPKKPIAHKSIEEMTEEEIEKHLAARKHGIPNFIACEQEIMKSVPGAEKAMCPDCGGTQFDLINKSTCTGCRGYGYLWMVDQPQDQDLIRSIEVKHNVHKAIEGPQRENRGGGRGAADTTPEDGTQMQDPELHSTATSPTGKTDNMTKANHAVLQEMREVLNVFKGVAKQMEGEPEEGGDDDTPEMPAGGPPTMPPVGGGEEAEKCAKSLVDKALLYSVQVLTKGMGALMEQVEGMGYQLNKAQAIMAEQGALLKAVSASHVSINKSLFGGNGNGTPPRVPARAPMARQSNVQVVQKSFSNQAPGADIGERPFSIQEYKKAATDMVLKGKLNHRVGLLLDTGNLPDDENVVKSIEAHLEANPGCVND